MVHISKLMKNRDSRNMMSVEAERVLKPLLLLHAR